MHADIREPPFRQFSRKANGHHGAAGGRALIPKNSFGWPILAGFACLRRAGKGGVFLLLLSNFPISIFEMVAGGPRLNSKKTPSGWVYTADRF